MIQEKEVQELSKEISPVVVEATKLSIKSSKDMEKATEILSRINKYADTVDEKKTAITKPLNEALKAARNLFKPLEERLEAGVQSIRNSMSAYQTEQIRAQREEEAKIAAKVAEGKLSVDKAVSKLDSIEKPAGSIATQSGSVAFREHAEAVIVDVKSIPREYLVPDERKILIALKAGKKVKGCELKITQIPINRR